MFIHAETKLEDSRFLLEELRMTSDAPSFRALFNSFLNAARAITYALQEDGAHITGFSEWYEIKRVEMRGDELLRFIHEARIQDFHKGKHHLNFATYMQDFYPDAVGPPPSNNAKLAIGNEGPFWIVDEGTPKERRIPIKQGGNYIIQASIANAPTTHKGRELASNDPLTIFQTALDYFSNLVHEAKTRFAP